MHKQDRHLEFQAGFCSAVSSGFSVETPYCDRAGSQARNRSNHEQDEEINVNPLKKISVKRSVPAPGSAGTSWPLRK